MKKLIISLFSILILFTYSSCDDEEENTVATEIVVPENFTVDIPSSISTDANGGLTGRTEGDGDGIIEGNEIYQAVPFFIFIGEESARIIELIFPIAAALEQQNVQTLIYTSDDDGRDKEVTINRNVTRGGKEYAYELTTFDVLDNAQALQMLWNTEPIEGIAIISPYQIDHTDDSEPDALLRIDYSEDDPDYEATMTVYISGIDPEVDGLDNLKLWAGRNGNVVDVVGNSNHPGFVLFDANFTGGRNYAFVGRGDETTDIGVINLALPPSNVTTNNILTEYSVYNVLFGEIDAVAGGFFTPEEIDDILAEANSPAYFNDVQGFITSGLDNQPAGFSNEFIDLSNLTPFVPNDIRTLEVQFIIN
ncbi:hypothetical protein [Fulvivirga lutea]|uniref:DUF4114 domain-containing protein n=1 Tax=Fulvivirga lutea TaxID=2810512 RepID=A0A974ZZH5_9BACT|nr:hypothetical protein [Fulvivirga lutea]QSE96100.1 hypothetical protein JR347_10775 [Fulvivirga lutea]